MYIAQVSRFV